MAKKKVIRIGVDLDGVVAKHSLGGFWIWLRKLKEKLLKKTAPSHYYYPSLAIERISWRVINWLRSPSVEENSFFTSLAARREVEFHLVTSRFEFLEKLTIRWLKKHNLYSCFRQIMINVDNLDPLIYKDRAVKNLGLDCFIDDDLEVVDYLQEKTKAKLYWVVPGHKERSDNHDSQIETCQDFTEALEKIFASELE